MKVSFLTLLSLTRVIKKTLLRSLTINMVEIWVIVHPRPIVTVKHEKEYVCLLSSGAVKFEREWPAFKGHIELNQDHKHEHDFTYDHECDYDYD